MKRVLSLFCLLITFLSVKAEIIISSPSNSYFTTGGYVFLDVNVDGINDYLIRAFDNGSQTKITVRGYNNCQVEAASDGKAMGLSQNAPIGNNSWRDTALLVGFDQNLYYFPLGATAFIGVKLNKNNQTYYGYITMNISGSGSLNIASVYNYAYEDVPNRPIFAGSTISVNTTDLNRPASLFWNGHAICYQTRPEQYQQLVITDVSGRRILETPVNQGEQHFPLSLPKGIYLAYFCNSTGAIGERIKFFASGK